MPTESQSAYSLCDRALFIGVNLLFAFVVFVPHRYVFTYEENLTASLLSWIPLAPAAICCLFHLALVVDSSVHPSLRPVAWAALAWSIVLGMSGLGSEMPEYALTRDLYYCITGVLLVFSAAKAFRGRYLEGVRFLSVPAAIVGGLCVYEFATGNLPFWSETFSDGNMRYHMLAPDDFGRRVLGTVGHPVYLGSFLVLMLPLSLWMLYQAPSGTRALVPALIAMAISAGLLLTFTRGAWLGGAVGGLTYLRHRSGKQFWSFYLAVGLLLGSAFSIDAVWETFESRATVGQIKNFKTNQRGVAYAQTLAILSHQPLFGIGTGMYRFAGGRVGDWNHTPDNMYLRILSEHGVVGLVVVGTLFVTVCQSIRYAQATMRTRGRVAESDLCRAVLSSVVGFLVDLVTCDALYFSTTRICFWIVVGLGLSVAVQTTEQESVT